MNKKSLLSLFDIFTNRIFRIPDFQRGYSWGDKQLNDFWDDIQNLNPNKNHYIGLLTVESIGISEVSNKEKWEDDLWLLEKGVSAFYLIDGQQRITTMIILVNELLSLFKDQEYVNNIKKSDLVSHFLYRSFDKNYNSFIFGYEKDSPSDIFFKTRILNQHSCSVGKAVDTLYTSNMEKAQIFFHGKLNKLDRYQREEIFDKIVNRFLFNYYEVDKDLDIHVTFETMNNRGKELSKLELLKNRLIYLSTLLNKREATKRDLREHINKTWKIIYEYLGKDKESNLNDDSFLLNHWILYFRYDKSESEAYSNFLLSKYFTVGNVRNGSIKLEEIKKYIESLEECVKHWFYMHSPHYSNYSTEINEWIFKLQRIGCTIFKPLLMAVLSKETNQSNILELLKSCERYRFLVFMLSRRQSNTGSNDFYRKAGEYYRNYKDTSILKNIIAQIQERIIVEGQPYSGFLDARRFKDYSQDLFYKNEMDGFYSWNGIRYFLYEYEIYLQKKYKGEVKMKCPNYLKLTQNYSIEHIYPQTPTDLYWIIKFQKVPDDEKKIYLNSLGNLLLISSSKNSKLQNYGFEEKCKRYDNAGNPYGYFNGSYSEIEVSASSEWTPEEIIKRGMRMLDFMEERWKFSFADYGVEKIDILLPKKNK